MAKEMNEVMDALHKISTEMSGYAARQDQLEAAQEQSSKQQDESLNNLRQVLNEVIHGGNRPERDKKPLLGDGELYSPSDRPLDFGDLATPSSSNPNTTAMNALPSPVNVTTQNPRSVATNLPVSSVSSSTLPMAQLVHTAATQGQPQPHSLHSAMVNTPLIHHSQPQPYVPPNLPSPHPRTTNP